MIIIVITSLISCQGQCHLAHIKHNWIC